MVREQAEKSVSATWHLYAIAAAMFFSSAVEGCDFAGKWMSLIVLALFSSALFVVFELTAVFRRVKLHGWRAALPLALLVATVCLTPETVQAFRMLGFKQLQPRFDLIVSKVVSGEYPEKLKPEDEALARRFTPIVRDQKIVAVSFDIESYGFAGGRGILKIVDKGMRAELLAESRPPGGWRYWRMDMGDDWYAVGISWGGAPHQQWVVAGFEIRRRDAGLDRG